MSWVFNIFLHLLLVSSLLFFTYLLVRFVVETESKYERLMRALALVLGAMIALGAQASGEGFATFIVDSLAGTRTAGVGANALGAILPAMVGAVVAVFFLRALKRNEVIAIRTLVLVAMLCVTAFAEVYAVATSTNGVFLGAAALPNVGFMVGLGLTILFRYDEAGRVSNKNSMVSRLRKPAAEKAS